MSHHRYFTGLIAAVFFLIAGTIQPGTANAESRLFIPDLGHSHIGFEVDHFGFSRTVGRFNRYDGEFMIDLDNQTWDRIEMTIITDSIDTNHKKRDQHLRAGDFLNVEAYPTMRFVGRNLVMHDRQTGRLEGDLT
ncbi:MAG: YceI family protein, partial [Pseudomonadota bacterium]